MNQEEVDKKAESIGLKKCTFSEPCDFCEHPQNGLFCRTSGYEYKDDFYWICGKCFADFVKRFPRASDLKLLIIIDDEQEKQPIRLPF